MFKPEELKEIEEESGKADLMKALPESLSNMLMSLDGKVSSNSHFLFIFWNLTVYLE